LITLKYFQKLISSDHACGPDLCLAVEKTGCTGMDMPRDPAREAQHLNAFRRVAGAGNNFPAPPRKTVQRENLTLLPTITIIVGVLAWLMFSAYLIRRVPSEGLFGNIEIHRKRIVCIADAFFITIF
jgi:hypothetical protein